MVENIESADTEAFDLALKAVLLDTLTDVISDAVNELHQISDQNLDQTENSTIALIQVILKRLGITNRG